MHVALSLSISPLVSSTHRKWWAHDACCSPVLFRGPKALTIWEAWPNSRVLYTLPIIPSPLRRWSLCYGGGKERGSPLPPRPLPRRCIASLCIHNSVAIPRRDLFASSSKKILKCCVKWRRRVKMLRIYFQHGS